MRVESNASTVDGRGDRRTEPLSSGAPHVFKVHRRIDELVEGRRQLRPRARVEPHADERRVRGHDLDPRTRERTEEPWWRADREVELDPPVGTCR